MSYFDGKFMDTTSYWTPPPSPNLGTILAMLNQVENQNPITEILSESNLSKDHTNDQSRKRLGLGERIAARTGFNIPTLERKNISPFSALFRNSIVPSPIVVVSPGFSPSTLLQTPNMFSNSLHIMHLTSPITNYESQKMVKSSCDATMMISNTELPHQPLQVNMSPPEEVSADFSTDESVYIPSHESQVEPLCAPLDASSESQDNEEVDINITSNGEESEEEDEDEEDDAGGEDEVTTLDDSDVVKPSSPKRRKFEVSSNMIGATRTNKVPRVIIQMETEEKNPDDGYCWRKYGQKVVRGNPNPRSYYKCTFDGCNVKKHVEKGACNVNLVVITYDGTHEHAIPVRRESKKFGSRTSSDSSMPPDHHSGRTTRLGRPPSSSYTTTSQVMRPFKMVGPPINMTHLYLTGLSKLPVLPVRQNLNFTYQNNQLEIDAIPNGTGVYNRIMNQQSLEFSVRS